MQLTNPYALWVLGFIPLLIIIHNLRSRPKQLIVTNLFIWREIISERNRGLRLRYLIWRNLPLLLQILIIILLSLALAKPVSLVGSQQNGDIILVLDTSASMKTLTESGTRFDRAKVEALKIVDQLSSERNTLIIEAGNEPKIVSGFSSDKSRLRDIIDQSQPTDAPGNVLKAIDVAFSFVDPVKDDRVVLISDESSRRLEDVSFMHQTISPILITGGENNVGITKLEFRQRFDSEDAYEILLEVKNFNPHPILCPVHLTLDGTTIFRETLGLTSFEKRLIIVPYSGLFAGTIEARLQIDDDFPIDNSAYSVLSESQDIWVLLVSKGNYFLEKLLEAYPNVLVNTVKDIYPASWETQVQGHDIIIIDRTSFPAVEKGAFLIIDAFSPSLPLTKIGQIDLPHILDWDRHDKLMANLEFKDLHIAQASKVKADNGLKPLLESSETGLIYAFQKKGLRMVYMGFDINQSNLPLKTAFPVMMSNIFQWLYPNKLSFSSAQVRAGEPFPIYLRTRTDSVSIRTPSGKREKIRVTSNPMIFTDTFQTGLYRITEGDKARYFAVNLVDESESDIRAPVVSKEVGMKTISMHSEDRIEKAAQNKKPIWFYFMLAALGVLVLEWYIWLRGERI